jgi:hypothetical protein
LIGKDLAANFMSGNFQPEKTAEKSLEVLKPHGITPDSLYAEFTLQDMIKIAKAKGMPDKINPYLERFHAHIGSKAAVGTRSAPENKGEAPPVK